MYWKKATKSKVSLTDGADPVRRIPSSRKMSLRLSSVTAADDWGEVVGLVPELAWESGRGVLSVRAVPQPHSITADSTNPKTRPRHTGQVWQWTSTNARHSPSPTRRQRQCTGLAGFKTVPECADHGGRTAATTVVRPDGGSQATGGERGQMSTGGGHPLGTPPVGALVIALSMAALVVLGVTTTAATAPSDTNAKEASTLVTEARAAMLAAGAVSATGGGSTHVTGVGRVIVSESDYAGPTSGSQELTMTSRQGTTTALPNATTLDITGALYVDGDAAFWSSTMATGDREAAALAGTWVQIPTSSPAYSPAAADLTLPSLVRDLFDATTYHEGGTRIVDGVRAVAVSYQNSGDDAGPVTCYLATGGTHLPVAVTVSGLTLHLSGWGRARGLAAPVDASPMPALPTTAPSVA